MVAGLWIDWDGNGFGTGAYDDCTADLISASYTRGGAAEITGAAQVGTGRFVLKNTAGKYNPDNGASPLSGKLRDGVPVWFGLRSDGTFASGGTVYGRFAGRITDISPLPAAGATDAPTVEIVCEDPLGWYGRTPVELTDACSPTCGGYTTTATGYYPELGSQTTDATGLIFYYRPGIGSPEVPTPGFAGAWHFGSYLVADGGAHGGLKDVASIDVSNTARCLVVGAGTISVYTRAGSGPGYINAYLRHSGVTDSSQTNIAPGTTITFTVPDDGNCIHWVDVDFLTTGGVGGIGFDGFDWTSAHDASIGRTSQGSLRAALLTAGAETRVALANEVDPLAIDLIAGTLLDLLTLINAANGTRHFAKPAALYTDWYAYTTRDRHYKLGAAAADASLSAASEHVTEISGWRLSADSVINQQHATIDWPEFPLGAIKVWEHKGVPVEVTTSLPFSMPVAFADYVLSCPTLVVVSSGATLTQSLSHHGYSATIDLTVASGTAVITAIELWGREAVREPQRSYVKDDTTSQALPRGVRAGPILSGDLVGSYRSAEGMSQHVVWRYASPLKRPSVTVENWLTALALDLYDTVAVTSPQLDAASLRFEIVGIREEVRRAASASVFHLVTTYTLAESRLQTTYNWFRLGAGNSKLSGGHHLAY